MAPSERSCQDPVPCIQHVLNCQIHAWYPAHRRWTIKTRIIDLSPEFVNYLNQDGFFLPPGAELSQLKGKRYDDDSLSSSESPWGSDSDKDGSDNDDRAPLPEYPEIDQIRCLIQELGGSVFPKLNWSSPKDAAWITCTGTLKCDSPSDVLLLLKASEFIQHDLTQPFESCDDSETRPNVAYKLSLRQWAYVAPSREFRCFVMSGQLAAISQRDYMNFYPDLVKDGAIDELRDRIQAFFDDRIADGFPDPDYVFDVCLDVDDQVFLVDFNPFSPVTDSLLFDWPELYEMRRLEPNREAEFRIRTCQPPMTPTSTMSYGFPKDVVHVNSAEQIDEFVAMAKSLQQDEPGR